MIKNLKAVGAVTALARSVVVSASAAAAPAWADGRSDLSTAGVGPHSTTTFVGVTVPQHPASANGTASPKQTIGCWITAQAPLQTVYPNGKTLYSMAKITKCTSPGPDQCLVTAYMYHYNPDGSATRRADGNASHSCSTKKESNAYFTCTYDPKEQSAWYTIGSLTVVVDGQAAHNDAISGNNYYWCR
ncbi:hypothetical protein [Actinoallomurus sp. NPDC050550]|uniref:hypothetical protein n=1 Tax=Actinoallomurus sp. NPDC050550 TaxID=3154937 RepID=UPI0033C908C4